MKKKLKIILVLGFILSSLNVIYAKEYKKSQKLYPWVDRLSFRNKPGLKTQVLGYLGQAEPVIYLGTKSNFKTKIKLRGKVYNEPWVKIKRGEQIGWTYDGGIKDKPLDATKIHWRAYVVYDPVPNEEKSEDWGWFTAEVRSSCWTHGILIYFSTGKDTVIIKRGNIVLKKIIMNKIMKKDWKQYVGYIFIEKGKKPVYMQHSPTQEVLSAASKYFGFKIKQLPIK